MIRFLLMLLPLAVTLWMGGCSLLSTQQQYEMNLYANYCFFPKEENVDQENYNKQLCERSKALKRLEKGQ